MFYNFCKIHKSLRVTPAMAAGVSQTLGEISDIVALIPEEEPKKRGSYKNKERQYGALEDKLEQCLCGQRNTMSVL